MAVKIIPKNNTETFYGRGDMSTRNSSLLGPFSIHLPSGEQDEETGRLLMEDYIDLFGKKSKREKLEEEPFLVAVYFKKTGITLAEEENSKLEKKTKDAEEDEETQLLNSTKRMLNVVKRWDLTNRGIPVPLTVQGLKEADVDSTIIYSILGKYYEVTRPPLELSEESPNTSFQEE